MTTRHRGLGSRASSLDVGVNYQSNFYQHDAMNTGFEYTAGIGIAVGN
jgi:hypothetical protein